MQWRKKFIWAELEATYGTDPIPTNADTILTRNLAIVPYQGNTVSRDQDRSTLGAQLAYNTGPNVQITFECELVGSEVADTPPAGWGKLLQACGMAETVNVATSVQYDPISSISGVTNTSVTMYFAHDGRQQIVKGCRGNVALVLERGNIPILQFTFLGFYQRPTDTAMTYDASAFNVPIPVTNANTGTFELNGYTTGKYERLSIDLQNNVVYRNVINGEEVLITDRSASIEVVVEQTLIATQDWFADVESHAGTTTGALNVIHDTGTGRAIAVTGPAVQLQTIAESESDGLVVATMGGAMIPSAGDDEVRVTIS